MTINYRSSLAHARFEADIKGVRSVFRSAEEALLVGFDPFLSLSMTNKGAMITLQEAGGGFVKKEFVFPAIKTMTFNGEEPPQRLVYASGGALYPHGLLILEGDKKAEIELKPKVQHLIADAQGELPYPSWVKEKFKGSSSK